MNAIIYNVPAVVLIAEAKLQGRIGCLQIYRRSITVISHYTYKKKLIIYIDNASGTSFPCKVLNKLQNNSVDIKPPLCYAKNKETKKMA
jgi:hypothetical protein